MMDFLLPEPAAALPPDAWRENVAAVVLDASGHVLLGLGSGENAYWHFPQGGISGKETQQEALRRELWEEVGLSPESYRIIACYGGLRYRYRKNNEKRERWVGQQQTYFLVLCHASMPVTDCSNTDEFYALTWVRWQKLVTELFAPVKRKVVAQVLAAFFPPHLAEGELIPHLLNRCTPNRYRLAGRQLAACPVDERALFGGGKAEMVQTRAHLALRLRAAHKAAAATDNRLLVLLHGDAESGLRQCVRRLASHLDALHLRVAEADVFTPGLPWELLQALPAAGGVSIVIHKATAHSAPQEWLLRESWLEGQGICLLKLYLHSRLPKGEEALLSTTDSAAAPWYIIPSERRWYRDYVVASLVADALEASRPGAPQAQG